VERIVLDPDEVNQAAEVTLTDGRLVVLGEADAATLRRVVRQLHTHRSSYVAAFAPDDDGTATRVADGDLALEDVAPLHLRVRELLGQVSATTGRSAATIDPAELLQQRTWTSSAGTVEILDTLTPTHRRNLVAWLERRSEALRERFEASDLPAEARARVTPADPWVAGTPVHRRLQELIAAESGTEQARDEARQVVRRLEFERKGRWPER
jgi:hypothetical protein